MGHGRPALLASVFLLLLVSSGCTPSNRVVLINTTAQPLVVRPLLVSAQGTLQPGGYARGAPQTLRPSEQHVFAQVSRQLQAYRVTTLEGADLGCVRVPTNVAWSARSYTLRVFAENPPCPVFQTPGVLRAFTWVVLAVTPFIAAVFVAAPVLAVAVSVYGERQRGTAAVREHRATYAGLCLLSLLQLGVALWRGVL